MQNGNMPGQTGLLKDRKICLNAVEEEEARDLTQELAKPAKEEVLIFSFLVAFLLF